MTSPPKFDLLLDNIAEVAQTLSSFTPHRKELISEVHERLDLKLLKQMLECGAFDMNTFISLSTFLLNHIMKLEAPVRVDETKVFMTNLIDEKIKKSSLLPASSSFFPLLPQLLQFVHYKFDLMRLGTNYQSVSES